jgi:hypothetical protein
MIRYALTCAGGHDFEGWFGSSADYEGQEGRGLLQCPLCGSAKIAKQIMSPSVAGTKAQSTQKAAGAMMMEAMGKLRAHVEETYEDVGDRFAAEARAIHAGEADSREIYGRATRHEVVELMSEGVPVAPMPPKPPSKEEVN